MPNTKFKKNGKICITYNVFALLERDSAANDNLRRVVYWPLSQGLTSSQRKQYRISSLPGNNGRTLLVFLPWLPFYVLFKIFGETFCSSAPCKSDVWIYSTKVAKLKTNQISWTGSEVNREMLYRPYILSFIPNCHTNIVHVV